MLPEIRFAVVRRRVVRHGRWECWEWTGATNGYGYGMVFIRGRRYYTHRLAYQLAAGPIPPRYVVDHLCENTICFNPQHLEAVTHRENILRSSKVGAKTRCTWDHEYTAANTYTTPAGARQCRICNRRRARANNARRREELRP